MRSVVNGEVHVVHRVGLEHALELGEVGAGGCALDAQQRVHGLRGTRVVREPVHLGEDR